MANQLFNEYLPLGEEGGKRNIHSVYYLLSAALGNIYKKERSDKKWLMYEQEKIVSKNLAVCSIERSNVFQSHGVKEFGFMYHTQNDKIFEQKG